MTDAKRGTRYRTLIASKKEATRCYCNWGLENIWRENLASYWWLMSTFTIDDEGSGWRWLIPTGRTSIVVPSLTAWCSYFVPSTAWYSYFAPSTVNTAPASSRRGAVTLSHPLWTLPLHLFQIPHIRRGPSSHGWLLPRCAQRQSR